MTKGYQKGYQIVNKEIDSDINNKSAKLQKILKRDDYDVLLVEHKDRLTRFGFNYLQTLLEGCNIKIEVVNKDIWN